MHVLRASLLIVLMSVSTAAMPQSNDEFPPQAAPRGLEAYTDFRQVIQNARRVIEALATAKFENEPQPDDKLDHKAKPECYSDEMRSFNRGYLLAHTAFNLFVSLQETGFTSVEGPVGLPDRKPRNFVSLGRGLLITFWTPDRLRELLEVRQSLAQLPTSLRHDLASFLSKLAEYRIHYERLKRANPGLLEDLFQREEDRYYWYEAYWIEAMPERKAPKTAIGSGDLSKSLDKSLRELSDVARGDPLGCFVEHYGPSLTIGSEKLKRESIEVYATKYMISFWRRRDAEGLSAIADRVITRVLAVFAAAPVAQPPLIK